MHQALDRVSFMIGFYNSFETNKYRKRTQKEGGKEHMMNVIMDPAMLYFLDFNILIFLCDFEYLIQINYNCTVHRTPIHDNSKNIY